MFREKMYRSRQPTGCGSVKRRITTKVAEILDWEGGDNMNLAVRKGRRAGLGVKKGAKRSYCYMVSLRPLVTTK